MSKPYLFRTSPYLVPKVWGGRKLVEQFGKSTDDETPLGESWEVADLPEGQSLVATGALQGRTLREVCEVWGKEILGTKGKGGRFPLLVKILDARRDLSVQVHPGPNDLDQFTGAESKDECWLILDTDEGGAIIHGLSQDGVSEDEFRDAIRLGEVEGLLEKQEVSSGDVVHVPPGTVHAICGGVALLEIQEPSDTTFRIYDYNRPGLDGKRRALHVEEALKVAKLGRSPEKDWKKRAAIVNGRTRADRVLVEAPNYRVEEVWAEPGKAFRWEVSLEGPQVICVLEGAVELLEEGSRGASVTMGRYESAVVPASLGEVRGVSRTGARLIVSGLNIGRLVELKLVDEEGVVG